MAKAFDQFTEVDRLKAEWAAKVFRESGRSQTPRVHCITSH